MIHRTLANFKRARIVIPQLSPTLTKAKIHKWFKNPSYENTIECYEPLFVLECSPDLVTSAYRVHKNHQPLMLIEAHDEGILKIVGDIKMNEWYPVGKKIGEIDDEDDDDDDSSDWLWQAHSYTENSTDDA
jgi:pyruvate/2-oxoglutarate dehydrogenase complex dihydrolipoamide acyltransferase (E2) component